MNDKTTQMMFSSKTSEWETPQQLFNELNAEFHFTCDVCASPQNAKCRTYFTKEENGLVQLWEGVCWCNPPYGRGIADWIKKALRHTVQGVIIVMLLPARTDTRWFHDFIYKSIHTEIRFLRGRLKFGGSRNCAPFPSMIVVFR